MSEAAPPHQDGSSGSRKRKRIAWARWLMRQGFHRAVSDTAAVEGKMGRLRVLLAGQKDGPAEQLPPVISRWGYDLVELAPNGRRAVALAEAVAPDLVLLETSLPGLEGLEAVRQIMARCPAPIVLMATHFEPDLIAQATAAGVMGFLATPVRDEALGPALALARSRFLDLIAPRKEVASLRDALLLRQQVERAKGILAQRVHLSEVEAHRKLQDFARRERCTLAVAASRVITADTFFAGFE